MFKYFIYIQHILVIFKIYQSFVMAIQPMRATQPKSCEGYPAQVLWWLSSPWELPSPSLVRAIQPKFCDGCPAHVNIHESYPTQVLWGLSSPWRLSSPWELSSPSFVRAVQPMKAIQVLWGLSSPWRLSSPCVHPGGNFPSRLHPSLSSSDGISSDRL